MHVHSSHNHHHHEHSTQITQANTAFVVGIALNLLFVIIEAAAGIIFHSLSLLSDAGHNLADVASLALSLLAFRLLKIKATENFTYGYRKTSVLVALLNAVILLVTIGAIVFEAVNRFIHPQALQGKIIAIVAGIGIVINGVTAFMFLSNKEKDLNIKSAYLHLLSDAAVSLGIVIGGIVIYFTHWYWLDSAISIIIALVILYTTWNLFTSSLKLSLDGVPDNIQLDKIKQAAEQIPGVKELHHIHVWAISTTENALTAHLVFQKNITHLQEEKIKADLRHKLLHENIHHTTLETEYEEFPCGENDDTKT